MQFKCKYFLITGSLSIFLSLLIHFAYAQQPSDYPNITDRLTNQFHMDRREALRSRLPDNSCAIIFSNPERIRSGDVDFEYHQNPDFFYLTGLEESNSILLIWKENRAIEGIQTHELIFVQPSNKLQEIWTGKTIGVSGAMTELGISLAFSSEDFEMIDGCFNGLSKILYTGFPKGLVNDRKTSSDLSDLVEAFKLKSNYPSSLHDDYALGKILRSMREVKLPEEILLMKKANSISIVAHREMMKAIRPGLTEFQIQAIGEYFFKSQGAESTAYPSICGAAENACVLHYQTNQRKLNDGDLLLLDMGAEYHGYAADVTRTLPVNGKFSDTQKIIYNLVLEAQTAAINECKSGNKFNDPDRMARKILKDGLVKLGILKDTEDLGQYYPHGTSHYLGLDVHDVGTPSTLKAGMVLTVEPGLYFPEGSPCDRAYWNIGIRIEDDILITENGFENLTGSLPRETSEIEEIIKEKSIFEQN